MIKQTITWLTKTLFSPLLYLILLVRLFVSAKIGKSYVKNPDKYSTPYYISQRFNRVYKLIKFLLFIKNIKVISKGHDKLPTIPCLYLSNHKSNVDALVLFKIIYENAKLPLLSFVAKHQLQKGLIGYVLDLVDTVFVNRNKIRQSIKVLENDCPFMLKNNRSICIFPEASRIGGNELGTFHSSSTLPAYLAPCPIIPVCIYNSQQQLFDWSMKNKKRFCLFRSKTVYVQFDNEIGFKSFLNTNNQVTIDRVKNKINMMYKSLEKEFVENKKQNWQENKEIVIDLKNRLLFKKNKT